MADALGATRVPVRVDRFRRGCAAPVDGCAERAAPRRRPTSPAWDGSSRSGSPSCSARSSCAYSATSSTSPLDLIFVAATSALLVPLVLLRMWWVLARPARPGRPLPGTRAELLGPDHGVRPQRSTDLRQPGVVADPRPRRDPDDRPAHCADFMHPDDQPDHRVRLASWTADGHADPVQVRLRRADGAYRLMEVHLSDLVAEATVRGIVSNVRDITDRVRLETELRHAQKLESVGQLASGIAHEINTPIQFIGDNVRFLGDAFDELGHRRHRTQARRRSRLPRQRGARRRSARRSRVSTGSPRSFGR